MRKREDTRSQTVKNEEMCHVMASIGYIEGVEMMTRHLAVAVEMAMTLTMARDVDLEGDHNVGMAAEQTVVDLIAVMTQVLALMEATDTVTALGAVKVQLGG